MLTVDISKSSVENVLALVTANNPGLPIPLTPDTVALTHVPGEIKGFEDTSPGMKDLPDRMTWVPTLNKYLGAKSPGRLFTSDDGVEWVETQSLTGANDLRLVYSPFHEVVIAHGQSGRLYVSSDGVNWTERTKPLITGNIINVIISPQTGYILLSVAGALDIYESTDLLQTVVVKRRLARTPVSMAWLPSSIPGGNQHFLIVNNIAAFFYNATTNQETATPVQGTFSADGLAISTATNRVLITTSAASNGVWMSDGNVDSGSSPWTFIDAPTLGFSALTYVPSLGAFVLHRSNTGVVLFMDDGQIVYKNNNQPVVTNIVPKGTDPEVIVKLGWFFAKTNDGMGTYYDYNATNYGGSGSIGDVLYRADTGETILVGASGIVGKLGPSGQMQYLFGNAPNLATQLAYSPKLDLYVAAAINVGATTLLTPISTSKDLINWTTLPFTVQARAVIWIDELEIFVAGVGNEIYTSPDGVEFTLAIKTTDANNDIRSIAYAPALNLIVAITSYGHRITSADGVIWFINSSPISGFTAVEKITWADTLGRFFVGNDNRLFTSTDGFVWTTANAPTGRRYRPTWIKELSLLFVASSVTDRMLVSTDGLVFTPYTVPNYAVSLTNLPRNIVYNVRSKRIDFLIGSNILVTIQVDYDDASKVLITALPNKGYKGEVEVSYYRPTIENIAGDPQNVPNLTLDTSLYDPQDPVAYNDYAIGLIANTLSLRVDDIELVGNAPIPANENDIRPISIRAKSDSYIYSGGPFTFNVIGIDTDIPITVVIANPALLGFSV